MEMPRQQHLSLLEIVNKVHEPGSLTQSLSISVLRQQSMHPTIDILICNHLRDGPGFTEQVCKYLYSIPSLLAIRLPSERSWCKNHHSSLWKASLQYPRLLAMLQQSHHCVQGLTGSSDPITLIWSKLQNCSCWRRQKCHCMQWMVYCLCECT